MAIRPKRVRILWLRIRAKQGVTCRERRVHSPLPSTLLVYFTIANISDINVTFFLFDAGDPYAHYNGREWETDMMHTACNNIGGCCCAMWLPCCFAYTLRERALGGEHEIYHITFIYISTRTKLVGSALPLWTPPYSNRFHRMNCLRSMASGPSFPCSFDASSLLSFLLTHFFARVYFLTR